MDAKIMTLCRCRVVIAVLFVLAVIILAVGCGTSSLGSYRAFLQDSSGHRYNTFNGKIEHNLFNGRYQKVEKEDREVD